METQVVRLPENKVIFNGIEQDEHGPWFLSSRGLGRDAYLFELAKTFGNGGHHSLVYMLPASRGVPVLTYQADVSWTPYEAAVTPELWAMTFQPPFSWKWHGATPANSLQPGYAINYGALFGLEAVGSTVFFSSWLGDKASDVFVFDPLGGSRKLITFSSKAVGGACCLLTDGKELVWLEGQGLVSGETYSSVNLMASPYATSTADLKPRVLRPAYQKHVITGGGVMGGGYVVHGEANGPGVRDIVTRLSDGHYWVLPPRAGKSWGRALYVDAEELAIVENIKDKFTKGHWTIVRRTIASLGAPRAPGSGFD
jgi:hypothetical protein